LVRPHHINTASRGARYLSVLKGRPWPRQRRRRPPVQTPQKWRSARQRRAACVWWMDLGWLVAPAGLARRAPAHCVGAGEGKL